MESTVLIGCPTCGRRYRYDAGRFGYTGVRIRCRTCESVMRVDVPSALQQPQGQSHQRPHGEEARSDTSLSGPAVVPWDSPVPVPLVKEKEDFAPLPPALETVLEAPVPSPTAFDPQPAEAVKEPVLDQPPGVADLSETPQALVADQDASLRSVLTAALREEGYQVTEVENGPAVRRALTGRRPQVVVLNVFLPEILGVTLCSEIKRHPQMNEITVLLVGSLYRRDRFMQHPDDLYGADGFIDGSAAPEEVQKTLAALCQARASAVSPAPADAVGEREELARLARIVVGDIILYNPDSAQQELAADNFLNAYAAEVKEGQALVEERFGHIPGHVDLYLEIVKETIARHCEAAGMSTGLRA